MTESGIETNNKQMSIFRQSNVFRGNATQTNIVEQHNFISDGKKVVVSKLEKRSRSRSRSPQSRQTIITIGRTNGKPLISKQTNIVYETNAFNDDDEDEDTSSDRVERDSNDDETSSEDSDFESESDDSSTNKKKSRAKKEKRRNKNSKK